MNHPQPSLRTARVLAARVLAAVSFGQSLSEALAQSPNPADPRDVGFIRELCYGTLRFLPRLRRLLKGLLRKPIAAHEREVESLLLLGLYQLLEGDVPPHAAIGETVEAARSLQKPWAVPLINGVLRTALRTQDELQAGLRRHPAAAAAHPDWMYQALKSAWPDAWQGILAANNRPPPLMLRVNTMRVSREAYLQQLEEAGIAAHPHPVADAAIVLAQSRAPTSLPGFADGLCSVQDAGAQRAAVLVDPQPGERILDACAAPGGKACHLLESTHNDLQLTALDSDPERCKRIEENLARLGLAATICVGDATRAADWWDGKPFQRILVDAPCSGLGVMRRHPDIKLLRRPEDIPPLAAHQLELLSALWSLLAAGGRLVYATCSCLPAENHLVVAAFLKAHGDAREIDPMPQVGRRMPVGRQILPGDEEMDGFYYAVVEKAVAERQ